MEFDLARSESDLSKAIGLDPRTARAYLLRGRIHMYLGRSGKAARDFAEFNGTASPERAEGYWRLAQAQELSGNIFAAQKAYERAAELDASDIRPALGIARILLWRKKETAALQNMEQLLRKLPKPDPEVLALKAVILTRSGRPGLALPESDLAIELFEGKLLESQRAGAPPVDLADIGFELSRAYHGHGDIQESLLKPWDALSSYQEGCRLQYRPSCLRARSLSRKSRPPGPAYPNVIQEQPVRVPIPVSDLPAAPEKPLDPKPAEKKKKTGKARSDPGERIYSN